jgi:hypothetical protein
MHRALRLVLLLHSLLTPCCGGRVELDGVPGSGVGGGAGGASSTTEDPGAGGFAPHPECAAADGTRICGGSNCPWLEPPECLGYGCAPAISHNTLKPSDGGVCWADLPDAAAELCYGCREGELCIHRTPDQLVCVPREVCEALWDLGVRDVCRYADKTPYDHQPIPSAPSNACPGGQDTMICGGGCGSCGFSTRCIGRSPSHPYGLCAGFESKTDTLLSCSPDAATMHKRSCQPDWACAIFDTSGSGPIARRYGICNSIDACLDAAKHLPGGVSCYDSAGKKLTP